MNEFTVAFSLTLFLYFSPVQGFSEMTSVASTVCALLFFFFLLPTPFFFSSYVWNRRKKGYVPFWKPFFFLFQLTEVSMETTCSLFFFPRRHQASGSIFMFFKFPMTFYENASMPLTITDYLIKKNTKKRRENKNIHVFFKGSFVRSIWVTYGEGPYCPKLCRISRSIHPLFRFSGCWSCPPFSVPSIFKPPCLFFLSGKKNNRLDAVCFQDTCNFVLKL